MRRIIIVLCVVLILIGLNVVHNGAIYLLHPSNKGNYEAMDTFIKNMKKITGRR